MINFIDIKNIKLHYLKILKNIISGAWSTIYSYFKIERTKYITENDSVDVKGNKLTKAQSIGPGNYIPTHTNTNTNTKNGTPLMRLQSEQITSNNNSNSNNTSKIENNNCAIYVTTKDAYTLTDGPTIFLANDTEKIAKFINNQ